MPSDAKKVKPINVAAAPPILKPNDASVLMHLARYPDIRKEDRTKLLGVLSDEGRRVASALQNAHAQMLTPEAVSTAMGLRQWADLEAKRWKTASQQLEDTIKTARSNTNAIQAAALASATQAVAQMNSALSTAGLTSFITEMKKNASQLMALSRAKDAAEEMNKALTTARDDWAKLLAVTSTSQAEALAKAARSAVQISSAVAAARTNAAQASALRDAANAAMQVSTALTASRKMAVDLADSVEKAASKPAQAGGAPRRPKKATKKVNRTNASKGRILSKRELPAMTEQL